MKPVALILSIALLAGCDGGVGTTLPDGVTAADVALFKTAVTAAGCYISDADTTEAVEAQTGFEDAKLRSITQYLTLAGESEPASSGFRLISGSCANA